MTAVQLDLFGEVEAAETAAAKAERARLVDGLTCLRDGPSRTPELLIGPRRDGLMHHGEVKASKSGKWAYAPRPQGLRFERVTTWGGWGAHPAHWLHWDELDVQVGEDPRLAEIRAWSESLTDIDAWKDRTRPYELWPDPGSWHPSYIAGDHERRGWAERLHAWTLTLGVLTDVIAQIGAT